MPLTLLTNINNNMQGTAPYDIYLNSLNNIAISSDLIDGDLQATLQACAQAARTLLGEMIYNVNAGIPYFQTVWNGIPNIQQYNAALRQSFLAVTGVVEVVSLITSQVDNTLQYTAIIKTLYGSGGING